MKKLKVYGTVPEGHPLPVVSWLIRLFEWSDISHTALNIGDGRIYHAHFNTVSFEDLEEWKKSNEIRYVYEFEISTESYEVMMEFCKEYEGRKSGYFSKLFGQAVPLLVRNLFGIYIKNTFVQGMKENAVCSELIRFLAKRYWNFKVEDRPYPENFTTTDVKRMMEANI